MSSSVLDHQASACVSEMRLYSFMVSMLVVENKRPSYKKGIFPTHPCP